MSGLINLLLSAPAERRVFKRPDAWINIGDMRAHAAALAETLARGEGDVFLHTTFASNFVAGVLAAAAVRRRLVLPAHAQPAYLAEISCPEGALLSDDAIENARGAFELSGADRDPLLVFFTSGSTGAPKPVEKNLSRLEIEARALDTLWGADAAHGIATVSHQHIYGLLFRVMWPLLSGRTADDCACAYWEELAGRMAGATLIASPAHLTRLPPHEDFFAMPPKLVFSSGQVLSADAALACKRAMGAAPFEVLGSTETGGIAWRRQDEADAPWTPFANIVVAANEEGALIVRSPYLQTDAPHETGDGLEALPGGRFRLKPRGDRVAKIDGKRVSLTRVEQALAALPEIESVAAFTLPKRKDALAAVVVLSADGAALLRKDGAFRLSRHLRRIASASLEPAERPKHWRFVDAIPTDSQGKRVLATLRSLFEAADPLDVLALDIRAQSENEAIVAFTLPPELVFFEGHFPGRAILPGVAQAHLAVLIAQKLWGVWPSDANLARLKFKRVLVPHDAVTLKLKRDAAIGRLHFSYHLGDIDVAQGEIGGFRK